MTSSTPQATEALETAQQRRLALVELRSRVKAGELRLSDVLLDPPEEAQNVLVFEALMWQPNFGREKLRRFNRVAMKADVNIAMTVGRMSPLRLGWIANHLRDSAWLGL